MKVKVYLIWMQSHSNIKGNETADFLAKQVAQEIETNRIIVVSDTVKLNSAFVLASNITRQSWQRKWDQGCSGSVTREFIPSVYSTICYPNTRNVGISYCRMLLNNRVFNEDGYRTQLNDSPVCDCGDDYESVNVSYQVCECQLYSQH